jgi:hypothetical protein
MDNFIIGAIIVLSLWFVFSMRSKKTKAYQAFNTLDEAEVWLTNEGLKAISINFSSYNDPALMKNAGATIVVGSGDKADGSRLGFALEVIEGSGVVEIEYLEPYGIASHHRAASQTAKMEGMYLLDVLQEMAKQYRALHSR